MSEDRITVQIIFREVQEDRYTLEVVEPSERVRERMQQERAAPHASADYWCDACGHSHTCEYVCFREQLSAKEKEAVETRWVSPDVLELHFSDGVIVRLDRSCPPYMTIEAGKGETDLGLFTVRV